ncbi:hypothetical protein UPYG_G00002860 [Umbra pygmaea]|uniref:LEM domain-containing protein n=1 Tax=Umbra pygmaea TaxID=75934 RepID=A0ABD0Y5Z0_UMBPY
MAALSTKSDQEIKELLDEYGIKHGPIVESTRPLYEKKLKEAMAKDRKVTKTSTSTEKNSKPTSTDKTFYREEEEEVTYVSYRTPPRSERLSEDGIPYMRSRPDHSERDFKDDKLYSKSRPEYSSTRDYVDEKPYSKSRPEYSSGRDYVDEPRVYSSPSASSYSSAYPSYSKSTPLGKSVAGSRVKEETPASSGRLIPLWLQLLVFLIVAGFLYFVFANMESAESNPFKGIQ